MVFTISLYLSLLIFLTGLIYKLSTWFRCRLTSCGTGISVRERILFAAKGIVSVVSSRKIATVLNALVLDVLCQRKLFRQNSFRWAVHMLFTISMLYLIFLHACGRLITVSLFSNYYSSLNPFLFLRNFFGAMLFLGLLLAVSRRFLSKEPRHCTGPMDQYAILLLSLILFSGILLEAGEIFSHQTFMRMVDNYSGLDLNDDVEEVKGLKTYWDNAYGTISPHHNQSYTSQLFDQGSKSFEMYCMECHSKPRWAFMSYNISKRLVKFSATLEHINFSTILWYTHLISSFFALAYLPFGKMFHLIVSPLSIMANAVMDENSHPVNVATRQVMELDACVHCGICNERCNVAGAFGAVENVYILPSEKMEALKAFVAHKNIDRSVIRAIENGLFFCTDCHHCSDVCPVGINLQALWFDVKEEFFQKGYPVFFLLSPLSIYRRIKSSEISGDEYQQPLKVLKKVVSENFLNVKPNALPEKMSEIDQDLRKRFSESFQGQTSYSCFSCMACSASCPVVENYNNPTETLGLLPHQVIRAANLGLYDLIFEANILWCCLGCYECQESCPQGVKITDILYELKNMAITHFETKTLLR